MELLRAAARSRATTHLTPTWFGGFSVAMLCASALSINESQSSSLILRRPPRYRAIYVREVRVVSRIV